MKYIKLKRIDSICNICKQNKSLSWDHVPPKDGIDLSDMWVQSRSKAYLTDEQPKIAVSQNGLKFRTICRDCNSLLAKYDITFRQLLLDVKMFMNSSLIIPSPIKVTTYPVRIAKCLLGHLLASKTEFCNTMFDQQISEYLLHDNKCIPDGVRIFFWFFPYNCTIIKTDIYELDIFDSSTRFYSVIKSFPLAFAIMSDNTYIDNANELIIGKNDDFNTEKQILFKPNVVNDWEYPEKLGDNKVHLLHKDNTGILATPKLASVKVKNSQNKGK